MDENRDRPFFLYIPFSAPHTPFQVPRECYDRFGHVRDHNKRVYNGMISALDDAVEMITGRIADLGLEGETLVIFTSDNGGATYTGATENGMLKAGKFTQFEGGLRVPLILSWEGRLEGGMQVDFPVSLMDIFATCTSVAGVSLPGDRIYDGIDLLPFVQGDTTRTGSRTLFWRTGFNKAVRQDHWKLVWNERDGQLFLYNLMADERELNNLASLYPEKVAAMKQLILKWEAETISPLWPGVMEFRFQVDGETTLWAI